MNEENRGYGPGFLLLRRVIKSVLSDVAVGVEIAVRVVPGVVQVLHVRFVITEAIGGNGALGRRSAGVVELVVHGVVMVVDRLASHSSTTDGESGRRGQNKESHG
jgi:hypothetical protein